MIPVIILDCENRSQEGVLKSFGRRKIPIIALSSDPECSALSSRYISKKIISPSWKEGEKYIDFLLNLPEKGVLIYSTDIAAELISKYKKDIIDAGYLVNIPEYTTFKTAFDKWECYKHATKIGIPAPRSFLVNTVDEARKAFKQIDGVAIIKGTRLAGGKYLKIENEASIVKAFDRMREIISDEANKYCESKLILQKFLDANITNIWCCESIYKKDGVPVGFLSIKKIRTVINEDGTYGSRLYAGENILNPKLEEYTKKILDSLNWRGIANLDWVYLPEKTEYFLTDFNPRLPGFSNFPSKIGFEMAYFYYLDLIGEPVTIPPIPKSIYFETFRMPGDLSGGIRAILERKLQVKPFIVSYLNIFNPKYKKVFDVFEPSDPKFTFIHWYRTLKRLFKKII